MTATLYKRLGGGEAIQAALNRFYDKVLADKQLCGFFDHVDIDTLKGKQRAFFTIAFGGDADYDGRDMRSAHQSTVNRGLDDTLFERFMGHFRTTLQELGVPNAEQSEVMEIAYSAKNEVLNR